MLIIVTDIEFLVARITDRVDSPSVTKTATRINLESPWLTLNWKGGQWHQHSFVISLLMLGQFTNHNDTDTKCC